MRSFGFWFGAPKQIVIAADLVLKNEPRRWIAWVAFEGEEVSLWAAKCEPWLVNVDLLPKRFGEKSVSFAFGSEPHSAFLGIARRRTWRAVTEVDEVNVRKGVVMIGWFWKGPFDTLP